MDAIQLRNVTKTFGGTPAVDEVSLTVPEGAVYGFIGPNGSGKTTTMRMIVNIIYPDSGDIHVFGEPPSVRSRIGYLPEERGLYRRMAVRALLEFHAELRGGRRVTAEITSWLERLDLAHCAARRLETLSKGMSQKVQFIAAVVPQPRLLILDEPLTGLDPVSADSIRAAILDLRRRGTTVILSTHDMHAAERMCDSIFMIFRGRKVLDGTLESIQQQFGDDTIRVDAEDGASILSSLPDIEKLRDLGRIQEVRISRGADPQEVLRALATRTRVSSFAVVKPSLEDIFVRIAGPEAAATDASASVQAAAGVHHA
jgi:ABC-2 type transport system ATP-binding protein